MKKITIDLPKFKGMEVTIYENKRVQEFCFDLISQETGREEMFVIPTFYGEGIHKAVKWVQAHFDRRFYFTHFGVSIMD